MSASSSVASTSLRLFLNGLVDSEGSLLLATILAILFPNLVILNFGRVCSGLPASVPSLSVLSSSIRSLFGSPSELISSGGSGIVSLVLSPASSSFFLSLFIVKSKGPSMSSVLVSILTLLAQWAWTNADSGIGIGIGSGIGIITGYGTKTVTGGGGPCNDGGKLRGGGRRGLSRSPGRDMKLSRGGNMCG